MNFTTIPLDQVAVATIVLIAIWRVARRLWRRGLVAALTGRPQVIDGDTLVLRGRRIRIAGIDAPELGQHSAGFLSRDIGAAAAAELRRHLRHGRVTVEPMGDDRYGRLLARILVNDIDVGAELIARGYAVAYGTRIRGYRSLEQQARAERRGLWKRGFERPADYRRRRRRRFRAW